MRCSAAVTGDRSAELAGTDAKPWVCFVGFSLLLGFVTALSTVEPWGRTPWLGHRCDGGRSRPHQCTENASRIGDTRNLLPRGGIR